MSGAIELLQEYCTTYRGGDWFDLLANSVGVLLGTALGYWAVRSVVWRKR
jgi:putative flippase GtrA